MVLLWCADSVLKLTAFSSFFGAILSTLLAKVVFVSSDVF